MTLASQRKAERGNRRHGERRREKLWLLTINAKELHGQTMIKLN